jgi:hypothetical protein
MDQVLGHDAKPRSVPSFFTRHPSSQDGLAARLDLGAQEHQRSADSASHGAQLDPFGVSEFLWILVAQPTLERTPITGLERSHRDLEQLCLLLAQGQLVGAVGARIEGKPPTIDRWEGPMTTLRLCAVNPEVDVGDDKRKGTERGPVLRHEGLGLQHPHDDRQGVLGDVLDIGRVDAPLEEGQQLDPNSPKQALLGTRLTSLHGMKQLIE